MRFFAYFLLRVNAFYSDTESSTSDGFLPSSRCVSQCGQLEMNNQICDFKCSIRLNECFQSCPSFAKPVSQILTIWGLSTSTQALLTNSDGDVSNVGLSIEEAVSGYSACSVVYANQIYILGKVSTFIIIFEL